MSTPSVLILGGTSDMGRAIASRYGAEGWNVMLAGRNPEALQREVSDIATRSGMAVTLHAFDVLNTASFPLFIDALPALPNTVISVIGLLGDQPQSEKDATHATLIMRSNFEGPSLILSAFAERFVARGSGAIVGISSVAGDRGRASNYTYGAAKAGFTAFLSGMRNRLAKKGVRVVTVKPGFVHTRMTAGMKLPEKLTAKPQEVGDKVYSAAESSLRDVIYVRPIWRLIMLIITSIPEAVFKRMSL